MTASNAGIPIKNRRLLKEKLTQRHLYDISDEHLALLAIVPIEHIRYHRNKEPIADLEKEKYKRSRYKILDREEELSRSCWTQEDLALAAGIKPKTVQRMLSPSYDKGFSRDTIIAVSTALNVKPEDIAGEKEWNDFINRKKQDNKPIIIGSNFKEEKETKNPMLYSEYTQGFKDIFELKLDNFTGRKDIFTDFRKYLTNSSGYYILRGEPGEGKSAIMAKYASEHKCLFYFNRRSEGQNTASIFLDNICKQIIECYKLEEFYDEKSWSIGAIESGVFLKTLLEAASSKLSNNEKIIILIDALDEVDIKFQRFGSNILYLPQILPKNVFFFLTARKEATNLQGKLKFQNKIEKKLEDFPDSLIDIEDFIKKLFEDKRYKNTLTKWIYDRDLTQTIFINELIGKSNNIKFTKRSRKHRERNFMFVSSLMKELADPNGIYQNTNFSKLPGKLEEYYNDHWILMDINAERCKIICVICESEHPSSSQNIFKKSGINITEVELVIKLWKQFLITKKYEQYERLFYSLYHESYRDYIYKKPEVKSACGNSQLVNAMVSDNMIDEFGL